MNALRKAGRYLAPEAKKGDDGRDQWGSRASFVLAAMGGAVGLGNLLRFPGQVFANNGLQWFIPYLIALIFLGIPVLLLEISIGQAYRGGCAIAYDHINKRTKGVGLAVVFNGYAVVVYYVPILAWIMHYFRSSFQSPLPWKGRGEEFYYGDVIANIDPIPGTFTGTGGVESYASYPGTAMVGETVGWLAFVWVVVWLCMFKGMGLTGRVVYFTMGLPLVMAIILIGRGTSLPNAGQGIKLYFGEWHTSKLASGDIWQAACGQIFFSIGVGFGYFTSYASYNNKYANAVQDALIIGCSNCLYECLVAFSVFGVIGHLGLFPDEVGPLGTFTIGFLTYPQALAQIPGAPFWAVLFFFTVMLLGISSAFALLEAITTLVCDSTWGQKTSRTVVSTVIVLVSFLLSLMYATQFGFYLLDAVDTWVNGLALFFVVWFEIMCCTTVYRWKDVVSQVGLPAFVTFHAGYFSGHVFGLAVAHSVSPGAGAGLGFGLAIAGFVVSAFIARTPATLAPRFWSRNALISKLWWLAFYSGNQLRRDLNATVADGPKNWKIPIFWGPTLKYISAPILAIIFSFAYPSFHAVRNDPLHIFAFAIMHLVMVLIALGFILPRWLDVFVPVERRGEADVPTIPGVTVGEELTVQITRDSNENRRVSGKEASHHETKQTEAI